MSDIYQSDSYQIRNNNVHWRGNNKGYTEKQYIWSTKTRLTLWDGVRSLFGLKTYHYQLKINKMYLIFQCKYKYILLTCKLCF